MIDRSVEDLMDLLDKSFEKWNRTEKKDGNKTTSPGLYVHVIPSIQIRTETHITRPDEIIRANYIEKFRIRGGTNEDGDMTASGAYIATIYSAIETLLLNTRGRTYNNENFYVISNSEVMYHSQLNSHFSTITGFTEYQRIVEQKEIQGWIIDNALPNVLVVRTLEYIVETGLLKLKK